MSAGNSNDVRRPGEVPSGIVARPALVAALNERVVTPPLRSAPCRHHKHRALGNSGLRSLLPVLVRGEKIRRLYVDTLT